MSYTGSFFIMLMYIFLIGLFKRTFIFLYYKKNTNIYIRVCQNNATWNLQTWVQINDRKLIFESSITAHPILLVLYNKTVMQIPRIYYNSAQ